MSAQPNGQIQQLGPTLADKSRTRYPNLPPNAPDKPQLESWSSNLEIPQEQVIFKDSILQQKLLVINHTTVRVSSCMGYLSTSSFEMSDWVVPSILFSFHSHSLIVLVVLLPILEKWTPNSLNIVWGWVSLSARALQRARALGLWHQLLAIDVVNAECLDYEADGEKNSTGNSTSTSRKETERSGRMTRTFYTWPLDQLSCVHTGHVRSDA